MDRTEDCGAKKRFLADGLKSVARDEAFIMRVLNTPEVQVLGLSNEARETIRQAASIESERMFLKGQANLSAQ